jgi:hypothetical protein
MAGNRGLSRRLYLIVVLGCFVVAGLALDAVGGTRAARSVPQLGRSMAVQRVGGSVRIKAKGGSGFKRLTGRRLVPLGSTMDTTDGRAAITTARDTTGTQTFELSLGRAVITQSTAGVTAKMVGGRESVCRSARRSSAVRVARHRIPRKIRRIRMQSSGQHQEFTVEGKYNAGASYGTDFTVEDRCDGTATSVKTGTVQLRERVSSTTLGAGQSSVGYCAYRGFPSFGATCFVEVSRGAFFFLRITTTIYTGSYDLCITAPAGAERCHPYALGPTGMSSPPNYPTDIRSAESACAGARRGWYRARWRFGGRQLGVPLYFKRQATSFRQHPESGTCYSEATLAAGSQQYVSKPTTPPFMYGEPVRSSSAASRDAVISIHSRD